jgi:hypothetical protein
LEALSSRFAPTSKALASSLPLQTLADLGPSKSELRAENALLRQQRIELKSRRVIHVGLTRWPTAAWVAHHLREAPPSGQAPNYLMRATESKFGSSLARVAATSGIKILKTPYPAQEPMPSANAS